MTTKKLGFIASLALASTFAVADDRYSGEVIYTYAEHEINPNDSSARGHSGTYYVKEGRSDNGLKVYNLSDYYGGLIGDTDVTDAMELNLSLKINIVGNFQDAFHFDVPNAATYWNFKSVVEGSVLGELFLRDFPELDLSTSRSFVHRSSNDGIAPPDYRKRELYDLLTPGHYELRMNGGRYSELNEYTLNLVLAPSAVLIPELKFIASPVPEPSSIGLMLGGLGLVGFMVARRRKQA